jgi:hypothetical protein
MKSEGGLFEIWHTGKRSDKTGTRQKMKRGKERRRRELFEIKRKGKTKTKSVFDMAEIKRKRGELKRRRGRVINGSLFGETS